MKDEEKMSVKKGHEKEYEDYVAKNQDGYGNCAVRAGASVGKLLDEGKTAMEAEKGMNGHDLTGALAGCAAMAVTHFHPRGEEFKVFWNKLCGGTGEEKGVANPAIVTLG